MDKWQNSSIDSAIELSVVIPVHNEEESLPGLVSCFVPILQRLFGGAWEIVVVDDGSTDSTMSRMQAFLDVEGRIKLICLGSCHGQTYATLAGLHRSKGRLLATIDGDGQLCAADLEELYNAMSPSTDAVLGVRRERATTFSKKVLSQVGNKLRCILMGSCCADTGCSLRIFKRELVGDLLPFRGMHRWFTSLFEIGGREIVQVAITEERRQHGRSHYGFMDRFPSALFDCLFLWWLKRRKLPNMPMFYRFVEEQPAHSCNRV